MPQTSLRNQLFSWLLVLLLPLIFISAIAGYYLASQYTNLATINRYIALRWRWPTKSVLKH